MKEYYAKIVSVDHLSSVVRCSMPIIRIPWMVGQPRKHYWQEQARMVFYCDTLAVLRSKNQTNNCSVIQLDLLAC